MDIAVPHTKKQSVRQPAILPVLAVGIVVFVAFLPTVRCGYINFDDPTYVQDNPLVLGGLSWAGVAKAFQAVTVANWAPLTVVSLQLDATLFGPHPWGFHLTNALLHGIACGLLCLAFGTMTGDMPRSAIAIAFFGLHPLRVESVAWISERKDVLSVLCLAIALLAYERYARRRSIGRWLTVALAMAFGLLAKSSLVTLPVLFLLLDFWPLGRTPLAAAAEAGSPPPQSGGLTDGFWAAVRRTDVRIFVEKIPLLALSAAFAVITIRTQSAAIVAGDERPMLTNRLPNALHALCWYLRTVFWPGGLSLQYPHMGDKLTAIEIVGYAVMLLAIVAAAIGLARRQPVIIWALAWLLVALLPMIGIVQAGDQGRADRYSYIAHIGPCIAAVWCVADIARGRIPTRWLVAGAASLLIVALVFTQRQILVWRDSEAVWRHALAVDPYNTMANVQVGTMAMERGDTAAAERHYRVALQHSGDAAFVCARLARLLFDIGDDEAARHYRDRCVAVAPEAGYTTWLVKYMRRGRGAAHDALTKETMASGLAAARASRFEQAAAAFQQILDRHPDCGEALNNLGLALDAVGRRDEALTCFERAVAANPQNADFRINFSYALLAAGRREEAAAQCAEALLNDPTDAAALGLWERLSARRIPGPSK